MGQIVFRPAVFLFRRTLSKIPRTSLQHSDHKRVVEMNLSEASKRIERLEEEIEALKTVTARLELKLQHVEDRERPVNRLR